MTNSILESEYGYCRAVVQDPFVFISGTAGYNYTTMEMPDDIEQQTQNCWETIAATLSSADGDLSEIVKMTVYLTEASHTETVLRICAQVLQDVRPAVTILTVKALPRPEISVLIEATAMWRIHSGSA